MRRGHQIQHRGDDVAIQSRRRDLTIFGKTSVVLGPKAVDDKRVRTSAALHARRPTVAPLLGGRTERRRPRQRQNVKVELARLILSRTLARCRRDGDDEQRDRQSGANHKPRHGNPQKELIHRLAHSTSEKRAPTSRPARSGINIIHSRRTDQEQKRNTVHIDACFAGRGQRLTSIALGLIRSRPLLKRNTSRLAKPSSSGTSRLQYRWQKSSVAEIPSGLCRATGTRRARRIHNPFSPIVYFPDPLS
jgi:hypothetical protein